MKEIELYSIVEKINGREIDDMNVILPILEDIKQNDESLYNRFRSILRDYKTHLAERICDNRQQSLFDVEPLNEEEDDSNN